MTNPLKPKKRTLADAEREITRLEREIERKKAELAIKGQECEFWTEQARNFQNHLQTVMRGQAAMLDQMARTSMTADDVQQCVAQVSHELRQPLTQIEATKAVISSVREHTQGAYTPVNSKKKELLR